MIDAVQQITATLCPEEDIQEMEECKQELFDTYLIRIMNLVFAAAI